jgi:hypothetical protein
MSLMPMNTGIYGQPVNDSGVLTQDISAQRKLAEQLRQQGAEQAQGQMISGHYVAPAWTQQLAKVLQSGLGGYLEQDASKKEGQYSAEKSKKFADILAGNKPQQIEGAPTVTTSMPAYTPAQQDQFGSPLQNVQREPVTTSTPNMTQETPEQQMSRVQPQVLAYMQQYGNTPEGQYLLGQLNKQDDRAYAHGEKIDDRNYADTREEKLYNRGRTDKLSDTEADHKWQTIQHQIERGEHVEDRDLQFAQQYKLQAQSQGFQAGQQSRSQAFQAGENQKSRDSTLANEKLKLDAASAKGKTLTEAQGKAVLYGTRAEEAHKILNDLNGKYNPMALNAQNSVEGMPAILGGGVVSAVGNKMLSPENQKAMQAQRDFVTAVLRQESGATISPSEFDNARKQYFPQPGDSEQVISQKKANRETAINGFSTMSSGAFKPNISQPSTQGWGIEVVK